MTFDLDITDVAKGYTANTIVIIDVREASELAIASLPNARHIPLGNLERRASEIPTTGTVVMMCHHGGRSGRATAWLRSQGWQNVFNMRGGINAWSQKIDATVAVY